MAGSAADVSLGEALSRREKGRERMKSRVWERQPGDVLIRRGARTAVHSQSTTQIEWAQFGLGGMQKC
jgi:hypothetical protein